MKSSKLLSAIVQVALILLASLLIAGVTWQVGQSAEAQQVSERGDRDDFEGNGAQTEGEDEQHEHGSDEPQLNLNGLAGFGEAGFKLVFVMAAVILGQRWWDRRQKSKSAKTVAD